MASRKLVSPDAPPCVDGVTEASSPLPPPPSSLLPSSPACGLGLCVAIGWDVSGMLAAKLV